MNNATTVSAYTTYGRDFADIYDTIFPREAIGPEELAWLSRHIKSGSRVLELGVGTGRVAFPLLNHLAGQGVSVDYRGIDISAEMLEQLEAADTEGRINATRGDIVDADYGTDYDSILCVCATISMITNPNQQSAVFANASQALAPGGTLIVETHNSDFVHAIHGPHRTITYAVPYPGGQRALVSFSDLDGSAWNIDHCWIDNGSTKFVSETSRVTTLAELDTYAIDAGLIPSGHTAGLTGSPIQPTAGTVTAEYRKPL
ncbi:class I SAM-dependent methyltransferase [Leifsonia sp. McL0607]|uniref:class I SAM-dependent methyltransferase n=1 Tax=Leifsonia sp. McL0607 TaxID=3415672 RepID=UPI003CED4483